MKSHKVPPKGSKVFREVEGDKRPVITFRVGGKVIKARMPGAPNRAEMPPTRVTVIHLAERTLSKRPMMPDPYHLPDDAA